MLRRFSRMRLLEDIFVKNKLGGIVKKNIELLIRSKRSALIIVLGPLFVILLIGMGFNTSSLYDIRIGSYSNSYSELADSILEQLETDQFSVVKLDNEETCINDVKSGRTHLCMIIPPNININSQEKQDILFYVDFSRINLVYIILDSISEKVTTRTEQISLQLTQTLLDVVSETESKLGGKKSAVTNLATINAELSTKISNIDEEIEKFNTSVSSSGLSNIENMTNLIEATNLSSSDIDFLKDNLGKIENQLASKISQIEEIKTNVKTELDLINKDIDKSSGGVKELGQTLDEVTNKISDIAIRSAERIVSPISTQIEPITTERTFLSYTFPTLLTLVIMFIGIILASTIVIREKVSNAYFRNSITPTKDFLFILGSYLTGLIVILVQLIVIIAVISLIFKEQITSVLPLALFSLIIIATLFIFIGMLIGYLFKSEETATLASITVSSIFLFFSNTILPIESLPPYLRNIADFNPFIISESILRKITLFQSSFNDVVPLVGLLAVYSLILFVLILIVYKVMKQSYRFRKFRIRARIEKLIKRH